MDILLTIPEETAKFIQGAGNNMSRAVLELAGYDAYRRGRISAHQLQILLEFETRYELWDFIKTSQNEGVSEEQEIFQREFGNASSASIAHKAERSA